MALRLASAVQYACASWLVMVTGFQPTSVSCDPTRSVREAMLKPAGMEQRGQQLHAVHQAGAGAVEVRRPFDSIDRAGLDSRQVLPARTGGPEGQFGRCPGEA